MRLNKIMVGSSISKKACGIMLFCIISLCQTIKADTFKFEMTVLVKKDVTFNQRKDSWGGINKLSGNINVFEGGKATIQLESTNIDKVYGNGFNEIVVPQSVNLSSLYSGKLIEVASDSSSIFESGSSGLLIILKPIINALIFHRAHIVNSDSDKLWDIKSKTFHLVGRSSELWVAFEDDEIRYLSTDGIGQKQIDTISAWLLSGNSKFLPNRLEDQFDSEEPSFNIYYGTIIKLGVEKKGAK